MKSATKITLAILCIFLIVNIFWFFVYRPFILNQRVARVSYRPITESPPNVYLPPGFPLREAHPGYAGDFVLFCGESEMSKEEVLRTAKLNALVPVSNGLRFDSLPQREDCSQLTKKRCSQGIRIEYRAATQKGPAVYPEVQFRWCQTSTGYFGQIHIPEVSLKDIRP